MDPTRVWKGPALAVGPTNNTPKEPIAQFHTNGTTTILGTLFTNEELLDALKMFVDMAKAQKKFQTDTTEIP
jgi:ribosomal protein L10